MQESTGGSNRKGEQVCPPRECSRERKGPYAATHEIQGRRDPERESKHYCG